MVSYMGCLLGCMFIFSGLLQGTTAQVTYTIGWSFPLPNSSYTFSVGDTLAFNVTSGYSLGEYSKANYESCSNKTQSLIFMGPCTVRYSFHTPGEYYYFCSIGDFCEKNMKLAVYVVAPLNPAITYPPNSAPLLTGGGLSLLLLLCTFMAFLY